MTESPSRTHRSLGVRLIGGPTALLEYGGLRFLTDPTFDPPRAYQPHPGFEMRKGSGPAIEPGDLPAIDAVLLSHDHHADNLDEAGRELALHLPLVLTTPSGAERLGGPAVGLAPWESRRLRSADGGEVTITATPAQHGPDGTDQLTGEVIGFYLSRPGLPTVHVSGDNASVEVVRTIVARLGSAPIALLHAGAARVPHMGEQVLTLSADRAVKVARILGARTVVPIHFEGWAHFSEGADELRAAFAAAGLEDRLRIPGAGESIAVESPAPLRLGVVGASGKVGGAIVAEALARGHEVLAISRHAADEDLPAGAEAVAVDALDEGFPQKLAGLDALVGSVSGRRDGRPEQIPLLAARLLEAAAAAGVPRLLWVGGAGSLEIVPGLRVVNSPGFPEEIRSEVLAQADALQLLREASTEVRWSYFSPAQNLGEAEAGGESYRVEATDALLRDEDGASRIALVDYARAALDELEAPQFDGARFTIAAGEAALVG